MFNSLKYVKKLQEAGVSREQAETHIQIVTEILETNLATREDLKDLGVALRSEMKDLEARLSAEMAELRQSVAVLEQKMLQSEQRLVIKLGAMVSLSIGVAVTLVKLVG